MTHPAAASRGTTPGPAGPGVVEHRWLILGVIALAQLMIVLDATVMNIALPTAQKDLGFSVVDRQWVVTAYALAFGAGLGLVFAPVFNTGTFGVAPGDAGVASATVNTGQQLGGSIGTSLLNTIFASTVAAYLTSATPVHGRPSPQLTAQAVIHGYATAFWWSAAILAGGALIALALFRNGPLTRPSPQPQPGAPAHATATPATGAAPAPAPPVAG